jgi:hypothetical protein
MLRCIRLPCALLRKELPGLVLALLVCERVELGALLRRLAARRGRVFLGHVDALAGAVGEANPGAEIRRAVDALEGFDRAGAGRGHGYERLPNRSCS